MIWQRTRVALLASMVALAAALPVARMSKAQAGECCGSASAAHGTVTSGSGYRTITVTETVPEHYTTTRTVYKTQKVEEKYTAYKIERVPETRVRKVTVHDRIPVEEVRTRTICEKVPVCEERTCMEKHWVCKQVTTVKKKCVDKGHWECREVPVKSLFGGKKCCDPCDPCCAQKTKTVRCWVPNKVWVEEPCTKTVRCCEYRPVTKKVMTCKTVSRVESYKVTVCKCVAREKEETYTVCTEKRTPYEACRIVCKCVPVQEQVTCCRMVKRCVEKQVPVCGDPCGTPCCDPCSRKKKCCK